MGFLYFIVSFRQNFFTNFSAKKTFSKKQPNMATPKKSVSKKSVKKGSTNKKAGLTWAVGRVGRMLRKGRFSKRVSAGAAVFLAATLEYLTAETLELASKTIAKGSKRITPRALTLPSATTLTSAPSSKTSPSPAVVSPVSPSPLRPPRRPRRLRSPRRLPSPLPRLKYEINFPRNNHLCDFVYVMI